MATTLTYLDGYCERHGIPGLMAEPIDVISNIGFIIAAWLALKLYRACLTPPSPSRGREREGVRLWDIELLIFLLFSIGIGSAIWHLFSESWALLFDVVPILLFINIYLLSFFIRMLKLRWPVALGLWLAFQAVNFGSEAVLPRDTLNGSIMYIPTWGVLALIVLHLRRGGHETAKPLLRVLGLFTLSLGFRTVDMALCPVLPIGTHFLWHTLNSVVLYRLLRVLIQSSFPEFLRSEARQKL